MRRGTVAIGICMDRLERVRQAVDSILRQQQDLEHRRAGFVHLYGVATISTLLALRRKPDPELIAIAAMLHDISSYKTGAPTNHAHLSALEAESILTAIGDFSQEEIREVSNIIRSHSAKDRTHSPMADLLKDADVLQQYLYKPAMAAECSEPQGGFPNTSQADPRLTRLRKVRMELGLFDKTNDADPAS
jgi:uncharacterized protein